MSLSGILFLAVIALTPIQLSKFIFTQSSFVAGIPIDYRAISVYLLDIAIVAYIFSFLWQNLPILKKLFLEQFYFHIALILFITFTVYSAVVINNPTTTTYWFLFKLILFSIFASFARISLSDKKVFKSLKYVIFFALFFEGIVAIGQFILQSSIGLTFLGERTFDTTTTSIAHSSIFGQQLLRSYGTFPHPNVVGAFFVIFALILYSLTLPKSLKLNNFILTLITVISIFLTFSKSALVAIFFSSSAFINNIKKLSAFITAIVALIFALIFFIPSLEITTISERLILAQASLEISAKNILFGVGPANFISEISKLYLFTVSETRLLQPVHNVFLLILTENGLIGLALFTFLLITVIKNIDNRFKLAIFISLLVFSLVDHFLWTLNQGKLLLWFSIAYILSSPKHTRS